MLSPRWRKVIRDLWANKTRTSLIVLAIAVGVFSFGSVFITQEVLVSDMTAQYRAIHASTITLGIQSFDASLVRWAKRQPEVADAQARAAYTVKLVKGEKSYNLDLYAYDDYRNVSMNQITLETGAWPPVRSGVLFERTSAPLAGEPVGGKVLIETPDGTQRELNVGGTVHDLNAIPANMFPQLSGYVTTGTLGWLGLPTGYNRLEVLTKDQYRTLPELEKVADNLKGRLEDSDVLVRSVQVRRPDEHWAEKTTQSFTLILAFIGLFSLVMSGFLVVNTMSALLAEQRRQIGIMKAVGATGRQITAIYLTLVGCYGFLSLLVAVPVGMGLAYLFVGSVANFLNIDIVNFHLPLPVLFLQVAVALVVPVIASLVPVMGGVRTTVREAISNYGIGAIPKSGLLDRMTLNVRHLPRPVLLSLRNTFRRKARLLMTLGTLVLAGTLFITVVNVRTSLMTELNDALDSSFSYEIGMALDGHYGSPGLERRVQSVPGVADAEAQSGARAARVKPDGTEGASFSVIGQRPDTAFMRPILLSGRWLAPGDRNSIVLASNLVKEMPDVQTGDTITLKIDAKEYEWKVVGIMLLPFDRTGYADREYVSALIGQPGMASQVQVRTVNKDGASQAAMVNVLEERLKEAGIKVAGSMTRDVITSTNASQFDFLVAFLLTMAAMTALIGGLGLAGMMSLNVMERTREIGVMRSIGASNSMISGIVLAEGILIGLASWALAVPLSLPMNVAFNAMLGQAFLSKTLVFAYTPQALIVWLVLVLIVSTVASLLPARRAARMSVRETLAYE